MFAFETFEDRSPATYLRAFVTVAFAVVWVAFALFFASELPGVRKTLPNFARFLPVLLVVSAFALVAWAGPVARRVT